MFALPLEAPLTVLRNTLYPKAKPIIIITNGIISDTVPNKPAEVIPEVSCDTILVIPVAAAFSTASHILSI